MTDVYVINDRGSVFGGNVLYLNEGDGRGGFVDYTAAMGVNTVQDTPEMGFSSAIIDADNDGLQDLIVVHGDIWNETPFGPPEPRLPGYVTMLRQTASGFENVSGAMGLPQSGAFRSIVPADLNDDGVLDLLITDVVDRPQLFLSTGCTSNSWLEVEAPVGSRVTIEAGGRGQTG